MLKRQDSLKIPPVAEKLLDRVVLDLHPADAMYHGNDGHYLFVGATAVSVILAAMQIAGIASVGRILDFGSGAGRVTRWFRAAFPDAEITVADIRKDDLDFCAKTLSAKTWISGTDIDALAAPDSYDLIWVGSVLTHLSAADTRKLLGKLIGWTRERGLIVVSLHGRKAIDYAGRRVVEYIPELKWETIVAGYRRHGYGYADYAGERGYGVSLTSLDWIGREIERFPELRLVLFSEYAWDNHHDVLALQRVSQEMMVATPGMM